MNWYPLVMTNIAAEHHHFLPSFGRAMPLTAQQLFEVQDQCGKPRGQPFNGPEIPWKDVGSEEKPAEIHRYKLLGGSSHLVSRVYPHL